MKIRNNWGRALANERVRELETKAGYWVLAPERLILYNPSASSKKLHGVYGVVVTQQVVVLLSPVRTRLDTPYKSLSDERSEEANALYGCSSNTPEKALEQEAQRRSERLFRLYFGVHPIQELPRTYPQYLRSAIGLSSRVFGEV